MILLKNLYMI